VKIDPSVDLVEAIRNTARGKDFFQDVQRRALSDTSDCMGWRQKIDHYRGRRYCMEFRDPQYPWPGSSSIVMPLIDKKIDEIKPQYVNLVTAAKPPVTAIAVDKASQQNSGNVELWFEWLIQFGSPGFVESTILSIDDLLEKGRGILCSQWIYETRQAAEILDRSRLPERLRALIVTPKGNADLLHAITGGQVPVINMGEFDQLRPKIAEIIRKEFDIDAEEPRDQDAFNAIMRWLKSGAKDKIRVERRDTVFDVPGIRHVRPEDLVLPTNARANIEEAERITEDLWFTEVQIRQKARDGEWNEEAVDAILDSKNGNSTEARKYTMGEVGDAMREGVSNVEKGLYNLKSTCCWFSKSDGAPDRKAVLLWSPASADIPVKFTEYVRPSGQWPYHSAVFELNKDRWYSARGIPEKIDDIDFEITKQHRFKLNRAEIATAPTIKFNPSSGINPATWRWIPGQMMPMRNPSLDAIPMEFPQLDVVFEREEQGLLTWVEQFLGGTDFGLSSPLSTMSEPRTATEIGALGDRARQSLSLRGLLFQHMMMAPVYREMYDLWMVHGNKEKWIQLTGSDPVMLTKEEMQGQFVLQCTGTIGNSDPAQEEQKALMRIKVLSEVAPMLGPTWELDMGAAVADWIQKSDMRFAKLVLRKRTDAEVKKIMDDQKRQQAAALMAQQLANTPPAPPPEMPDRSKSVPPPTFQLQQEQNGEAETAGALQ